MICAEFAKFKIKVFVTMYRVTGKKVHFFCFRLAVKAVCAGVLDPIVCVAAQYHEGTCKATGLVRWIH